VASQQGGRKDSVEHQKSYKSDIASLCILVGKSVVNVQGPLVPNKKKPRFPPPLFPARQGREGYVCQKKEPKIESMTERNGREEKANIKR
jgi:hypothetical protein